MNSREKLKTKTYNMKEGNYMRFVIRNKNKLKTKYLDSTEIGMLFIISFLGLLFLNLIIVLLTPLRLLFISDSSFIEVIATCIDIIILCTSSVLLTLYYINSINEINQNNDNYIKKIKDTLNTPYIDENDREKIYLLHELIINNGIDYSKYNQENDVYLELYLKNVLQKYTKFNSKNYDTDENDIIKNIINHKKINEEQAIKFFDQYISLYSKPKVRSIEGRKELQQKFENKNL